MLFLKCRNILQQGLVNNLRRDALRLSDKNFCSTLSSRDEIYGEALESAEVSSVTELVDRCRLVRCHVCHVY